MQEILSKELLLCRQTFLGLCTCVMYRNGSIQRASQWILEAVEELREANVQ